MRIRVLAALLGAVVVFGFAGQAVAVSAPIYYGSASSPIKAESASTNGNGWFYGAGSVYKSTHLKNRYWYKDSAPGGNAAYVQTVWYYLRNTCNLYESCFDQNGYDRSSDVRDSAWHVEEDYSTLKSDGVTGRLATRVCENQNNAPDDCSRTVIATFNY